MSKKKPIYIEKESAPGVIVSVKERLSGDPNGPSVFIIEREKVNGINYDRMTMLLLKESAVALGKALIEAFPGELCSWAKMIPYKVPKEK